MFGLEISTPDSESTCGPSPGSEGRLSRKLVQTEIGILLKLRHPNIKKYLIYFGQKCLCCKNLKNTSLNSRSLAPHLKLLIPRFQIQLREVFETDDEIQLVLELVTGGELFERIVEQGQFSEKDAAGAVRQILSALKTEYENSKLKLADFGLSKFLKNGSYTMNTLCGTVGYCAPEILLNKEYDLSVDLWSVGVVMYIMLCGYEPFWDDAGEIGMCKRVVEGEFEFSSPWWDDISDSAKDLISQLLQLEPSSRPTASEALEHPWVKGETPRCTNMASVVKRLREFNAKRKFRAATHAVLATRRAMYLISPERRLTKGLTSPQC
uniref:Protein kinase domain-containing protein n=2 Tax=Timema TaxID=61471 RepID=A0A7R9PPI7_TIMGE|nr:unnamed protein product [Timema genevievae]